VLVVYSVFLAIMTFATGSADNRGFLPFLLIFMVIGAILVALGLRTMFFHGEVEVEEVRHLDLPPEALSGAVARMLEEDGIPYHRDGPLREREGYWLDTFHLRDPPWEGFSLVVELNPLVARVDKAAVTVRCTSMAAEPLGTLKERIDGAVMRAQLEGFESEARSERPDLVLYEG